MTQSLVWNGETKNGEGNLPKHNGELKKYERMNSRAEGRE